MGYNKTELLPKFKLARELAETKRATQTIKQTQLVGADSVQIGLTDDVVLEHTVTPWGVSSGGLYGNNGGLIGTFLCVLQYDDPKPGDVVNGELEVAVNKDVDSFDPTHSLSFYYGSLYYDVFNDRYLEQLFYETYGYHPVVKVVRLYTLPSSTESTFYIHTRWRYLGVGKTLVPATGDISILP